MLLYFQNYLICLSLTSCSVYESHTLVCNFCSWGHHLLHYPSCVSVFGKEREHCKEESDPFWVSTALAATSVVSFPFCQVRSLLHVLDRNSHSGCVGFEAISQRSDLVRVGPFPNYSWKRWDQFLKQHSVSRKKYLVRSCNISQIFYKEALYRKTWEQTDWKWTNVLMRIHQSQLFIWYIKLKYIWLASQCYDFLVL